MSELISVVIKKPPFSIAPDIEKWQEENWEKFKKWIEANGGIFEEHTPAVNDHKNLYKIKFAPIE